VRELPEAVAVEFTQDEMVVRLSDGRKLGVPVGWFPWLATAPPAARQECELVGNGIGIHWPQLGEDLFVLELLDPEGRLPVL
jgi:hypothetical protein